MNTHALIEREDYSEAVADSEARVLRGVVLIRAGLSKNGREYSESVLQKSAPVFNGVKAYANHGNPKDFTARSMRDLTGWYTNVEYREGKLVADRHFAPTQAGQDAWAIAEAIASGRAPKDLAGLSINAIGQGKSVKRDTGVVLEVQSIDRALSVDDVSDAAAGGSYVESEPGSLTTELLNALTFQEWFDARPDFMDRVKKEMQTARQDKAVTAAKAEADDLRRELEEAQTQLETARTEREAAVQEAATARRELAIEKLLKTAKVPEIWSEDLRKKLMIADENDYAAIIEAEQTKAKAAGYRGVVVTGADQQVNVPIITEHAPIVKPLDMSRFSTPEELAAHMKTAKVN